MANPEHNRAEATPKSVSSRDYVFVVALLLTQNMVSPYLSCLRTDKEDSYIERLKENVILTFGRTLDAPNDFDYLSSKIAESTSDNISPSTLKRLFGYIQPATIPRTSTLSTLARYVGYKGWSDFCQAQDKIENHEPPHRKNNARWIGLITVVVVALGVAYVIFNEKPVNESQTGIDLPLEPTVKEDIFLQQPQVNHHPGQIQDVEEAKKAVVNSQEVDPKDIYENILNDCLRHTKAKCDSIRQYKSKMDIIEYHDFMNKAYFELTFTYMDSYIKNSIASASIQDEFLSEKYYNDIFAQCRDWNVNLMREIVDEYNAAIREQNMK